MRIVIGIIQDFGFMTIESIAQMSSLPSLMIFHLNQQTLTKLKIIEIEKLEIGNCLLVIHLEASGAVFNSFSTYMQILLQKQDRF